MAPTNAQVMGPALIERVDIHKSCKALETIVNVFNDYCQAAESLAVVQKKLSRALKDAAGLKATNEIASGALNAVASLLEALADVDTRFVKVADKECEESSNEVKKWFKKLAKEEKNHDEKIAATNARIKQAGQQYEKKAKKKDLSAAEEHARYVNLLSVVGPEMSQEKYNHSLFVTQRHTATIYSVASSISRTADAEWTRACECVRRFSPLVGRIGECRAYLEGGWTKDPPLGVDTSVRDAMDTEERRNAGTESLSTTDGRLGEPKSDASPSTSSVSGHSGQRTPAPAYTPNTGPATLPTEMQSSQTLRDSPNNPTPSTQTRPPPPSSFPGTPGAFSADSVRSIESLSSFPAPPAHFPIPSLVSSAPGPSPLSQYQLPSGSPETERLRQRSGSGYFARGAQGESDSPARPQTTTPQPVQAGLSQRTESYTSLAPVVESPKSLEAQLHPSTPALTDDSGRSPMSTQGEPPTPRDRPVPNFEPSKATQDNTSTGQSAAERFMYGQPSDVGQSEFTSPAPQRPVAGERKVFTAEQANEFGQKSPYDAKRGAVERTESVVSTSSVVASMRDKLVRANQTASPPRERDIPRIPGKVSDLASRYAPVGEPPSPISPKPTGRTSPITERTRSPPILERRQPLEVFSEPNAGPTAPALDKGDSTPTASDKQEDACSTGLPTAEEIAARRRRLEELEELELREQAHALRIREREIEQRALELQRERERLQGYGVRARANSSTVNGAGNAGSRPHSQYSYSTTNLPIPRGHTATETPSRPVSQYGELLPPTHFQASASSSSVSIPRPPPDHAPYCGCYACSAAQYSVQSQAQPHSPTEMKPEKPKGWMRRLSMPVVGNAFNSDSKSSKGISSNNGIGVASEDTRLKLKASFEQDATGGISNVRPRKMSFGRR